MRPGGPRVWRSIGGPPVALTWAAPMLLLTVYAAARGPVVSDDTVAFALWADRLIATRFDYLGLAELYGSKVSLSYALFVTLLAGLKLAFGSGWLKALVIVHVLSLSAVGFLLVRLVARTTGSGVAAWFALGAYLLCFDAWQWAPYALSDSSFLLLVLGVFTMEASRLGTPTARWSPVFAASLAASLYRPTGFLMVGVTIWSFLLGRGGRWRPTRTVAIAALTAGALVTAIVFGWIMQDPARWPFDFAAHEITEIAQGYRRGQVVWGRPALDHAAPLTLVDHWAITLDRLVRFSMPAVAEFSIAHSAVQLAFYLPVYALCAYLLVMLARGRTGFSRPQRNIFYAALGAIAAYALFHALVQVDYDWRYRIPIIPHLILLASGGLATLLRQRQASGPDG